MPPARSHLRHKRKCQSAAGPNLGRFLLPLSGRNVQPLCGSDAGFSNLNLNHHPSRAASFMDRLAEIIPRLQGHSALYAVLTLTSLYRFLTAGSLIKNDVILTQPAEVDATSPPEFLPLSAKLLLSRICSIPLHCISPCWDALRQLVWDAELQDKLTRDPDELFQDHGTDLGFSTYRLLLSNVELRVDLVFHNPMDIPS